MEEQVKLSELLRLTIDKLYLSILIDTTETIRYVGRDYALILGLPQEQIIGQALRKLIPNSYLPHVLRTRKAEYGRPFVMKNNQLTVCNYIPLETPGGVLRGAMAMSTFQDLDQVAKLQADLRAAREESQLYQRQLSQLAAAKVRPTEEGQQIIGSSAVIQRLKDTIDAVASSDVPVLLTGETGTGKEVFANAVHEKSYRRYGNYVKINCAAIPKELLESELFGYEGGSFSGALRQGKKGKFELANDGTLLLDEIGDMPAELQSKLLRVLQEHEVERLGGLMTRKLNFRLICSTNCNLEELVQQGKFRQDLYYRINAVELYIPPLRARREDIIPLADYFVKQANAQHGCAITGISEEMKGRLERYPWPGNVRELKHMVERMCIQTRSGCIDEKALPYAPRLLEGGPETGGAPGLETVAGRRAQTERELILETLRKVGGNRTQAARQLGICRSQLYVKLRQYHIK